MKKSFFSLVFFVCIPFLFTTASAKDKAREYYQITVYHFTTPQQEQALDAYIKNGFLPAIHKLEKGKIGVFKPIANDTAADKLLYVIIPFSKAEALLTLPTRLQKDAAFTATTRYFDTGYQTPPYQRIENIALQAFPLAPLMQLPKFNGPAKDRVYELRSYESATEMLHRNKVQMFNEGGETAIFSRLQFNPVFYASAIVGSHLPNLMYLTSFDNMTQRDAHWKAFGEDAAWKKLSALPEYQHNVSKITIWFLRAADYSDY